MMSKSKIYRYSIFCLLAFAGSLLSSCADKDIVLWEEEKPGNVIDMEFDGYSIGFAVNLQKEDGTRADDEWDDYIDTRDKFRVLFFDQATGNFIFEAIDRTVTPFAAADSEDDTWYVRIPMNYIVDRDGNVYDAFALRNYLREHPFKIAVLANWPNAGTPIEGETEDDSNDNPVFRPDTYYAKGEPNWGYFNSLLCDKQTDPSFILKNINDLHHLEDDDTYTKEDGHYTNNVQDRPSKKETYSFIVNTVNKVGKMGVKENWVKSNQESALKARDVIRGTIGPGTQNTIDNRPYGRLWYLWNFTVAYIGGTRFDEEEKIKWQNDWVTKNHWKPNNNKEGSPLNKFINSANLSVDLDDKTDEYNLSFKNNIGATRINHGDNAFHQFAVRLPKISIQQGLKSKGEDPKGFHLKLHSSGTLRILCASSDGNETRLNVYSVSSDNSSSISEKFTNQWDAEKDKKGSSYKDLKENGGLKYLEKGYTMNSDPVDIYIYCDTGTAADIYEIEYICDEYLYGTDRDAIVPSKEHPIPMYGVQNFDEISYWAEGSTYDLAQTQNKNVHLLRSVAKVELYIPDVNIAGTGEPKHVYMRSLNRHGRCEPMDVETPTDQLWKNHTDGSCEWFSIQKYGCNYRGIIDGKEENTMSQLGDYQTWLSWFYGSWASAKWKNNGTTGWDFSKITMMAETDDKPYPRLFNPCINRSDFAQMKYMGFDGTYHKYIMYMPDKMIDDPNYPGITTSIPKVAHIEFRYNDYANLDDNECQRVYFTDKFDKFKAVPADNKFESHFEKDQSALNELWPIMRNHVYKFVMVAGQPTPEFLVKVKDWGYHPTYEEW